MPRHATQSVPVLAMVWIFVGLIFPASVALPQDVVRERKSDGTTRERAGQIVDWSGLSLKLKLARSGRIREIDNDQIDSVETTWPPDYNVALQKVDADGRANLTDAVGLLKKSLQQESRPWAQVIVLAKLTSVQELLGQYTGAAESFFRLVALDPQSRFLHLSPLPWEVSRLAQSTDGLPDVGRVRKWLQLGGQAGSDGAAVSLVAAAWLMASHPQDARPVLEQLAADLDPTIAALAVGQLWRQQATAIQPVAPKRIALWRRRLERMPVAARAGPLYAIALAQRAEANVAMIDDAIGDFMRIVILYPNRQIIAAPALYRSAVLMHNKGNHEVAASLEAELKSNWPQSPWAQLPAMTNSATQP